MKSGQRSDCWVVDSGASRHTCCRRDWFNEMSPCEEQLQVGNEEWVNAEGIGTIKLRCEVDGKVTIRRETSEGRCWTL